MKTLLFAFILTASTLVMAKDYQVTGPVLEITETKIVIDKKGEKFEISKSAATKVNGADLKVGQKVTVYYSMSATEIEVKTEKKKK